MKTLYIELGQITEPLEFRLEFLMPEFSVYCFLVNSYDDKI